VPNCSALSFDGPQMAQQLACRRAPWPTATDCHRLAIEQPADFEALGLGVDHHLALQPGRGQPREAHSVQRAGLFGETYICPDCVGRFREHIAESRHGKIPCDHWRMIAGVHTWINRALKAKGLCSYRSPKSVAPMSALRSRIGHAHRRLSSNCAGGPLRAPGTAGFIAPKQTFALLSYQSSESVARLA